MMARREAEGDGDCWPEGVKGKLSNTRRDSSAVEQEIPVVKQSVEKGHLVRYRFSPTASHIRSSRASLAMGA